jgi:ribonuclease VapC
VIIVDSSALIAIALDESAADQCQKAIESEGELAISAATLAEALIVAERRGVRSRVARLVAASDMEIIDVTAARSQLVADAYRRWGKGFHPAALNFGDCFAYALAAERGCPLLYVGNDFAQTDIPSAFPA